MARKYEVVTGRKAVAAAGTAERLVSASGPSTKVRSILFQADGDEGIIIGDSSVDWTVASRQGVVVSDGTQAATEIQSLKIDAPSAEEAGLHGADGAPYIDLYDIWIDAETNADAVYWMAFR